MTSTEGTQEACGPRRWRPASHAARQRAGLLLLLAVCLGLRVLSMPRQTYTYDEGQHLYYGHQTLKLNSNRLEAELWVSKILGDGWQTEVDGQELKLVKGNRVLRHEILRTVEGGWDVRGVDSSKMPISALNALPGKIASHLPEGRLQHSLRGLSRARVVTSPVAW